MCKNIFGRNILCALQVFFVRPSRGPRCAHSLEGTSTTSEGLAQGPHVAARVGFEEATFRTEDHHYAPKFKFKQQS